jgi:hypothetical protein
MAHPNFATVPFGLDGLHHVQRTQDGMVTYLAKRLDNTKLAAYSLDLAEGTCKVLRHDGATGRARDDVWLPWPTDCLPYRRPMSMFPPTRRSSFDTLGKA